MRIGIVALTMLIAVVCRGAELGTLPPHPRLLFNAEGIDQLTKRIAHAPWDQSFRRLRAEMDAKLDEPIELPPRGGNWSHNYVCPEHGARLSRGERIGSWQWEHTCPVGPHTLKGDPSQATLDFDGNAISGFHGAYSNEIRELGVVYQLTGQSKYADRARKILLAYSDRYLTYPRHDNQGRPVTGRGLASGGNRSAGGRVTSQSLSEASWLIPVVQGADLIWDTLSGEQRRAVEDKLFRPALDETILNTSETPTIHNIQCRRNSAAGLVGFLLGDEKLIHEAIDGRHGYRTQMAKGVSEDGVWYEGAWGYHFFTIEGIWPLTEAARNCGVDLYGPELRRMFDAPLTFASPAFTLPPFNDSGEVRLSAHAGLYELAFARYGDRTHMQLLENAKRDGQMAMWFGVDPLPQPESIPVRGSHNAPATGYSMLRKGAGTEATWACIKYGPHGGGHGHFDKLNVVLYARGKMIGVDSGTRAYGSPIHGTWDKTTVAHNTLVIDQASQQQATGKCLAFGSEDGVDFSMGDAGEIYAGVQFVRTVALLNENLVLFVDHVHAQEPRTMDIAWHHLGKWGPLPAGEPWPAPNAPGYQHLQQPSMRSSDQGVSLPVEIAPRWRSLIVLAPGESTQIITGTGIGQNTADQVPMLLMRRHASQSAFVWAISIDGSPITVDAKSNPEATQSTVNLKSGSTSWRIDVDSRAGTTRASVS